LSAEIGIGHCLANIISSQHCEIFKSMLNQLHILTIFKVSILDCQFNLLKFRATCKDVSCVLLSYLIFSMPKNIRLKFVIPEFTLDDICKYRLMSGWVTKKRTIKVLIRDIVLRFVH
jgi:hypothetical protein